MSGISELSQRSNSEAVEQQIVPYGICQAKESAVDLVAGGVGAVVSVYVGQPLDTVKVKLQTFPRFYSGMVECFVKTFKNEKLRGLYAGTVPALYANIAENSILFAAYGLCQKGVALLTGAHNLEDLSTFEKASAGYFAAFFTSLVLCPTELVKCRLQAMRELSIRQDLRMRCSSPWKLTQKILRTEGVSGFYRGLTSTLAREMPGYFVFFGCYEACKVLLTPSDMDTENLDTFRTIICGGLAGVAFWVSVFPVDVTKSRIQVMGLKDPMIRVLFQIRKAEGFTALYSGLTPTVIRTFPATGALFVTYEWTKRYLGPKS